MTVISLILTFIGKKINLSERIIIKESLNQENFSGMVTLIKRVCKYTLCFELIGAMFLAIRFVPQYGYGKGIYFSIFHAISAFCNAGFDILGANSLIVYNTDILVNLTVMLLITIGGLGFTVWSDIFQAIKKAVKGNKHFNKLVKELSLHTKIVIMMTAVLLVLGTISFFVLEHKNKDIMLYNSIGNKLLKSAFQATTLRTAGFSTIDQTELTTAGKLVSVCFMFIGGSPASTSGGIKTTTLAVLILCISSFIVGKNEINIFGKRISFDIIKRAIVIFTISIFIIIFATIGLLISEVSVQEEILEDETTKIVAFSFMDLLYEVVSAFGTVGLSLNVTAKLSTIGKMIITILMIIGRLGPITISVALFKKDKERKEAELAYPNGNILIG